MKNFGFAGYDRVIYVATNGKMTEIPAAMGLTGLESLDEFIATNRGHYEHYRRLLADVPGLRFFRIADGERRNFQHVVVEIDDRQAGIGRDQVVRVLHAENVLARRYFHPGCHRMEPYRSNFPHAGLLLPETEALCSRILVLPTGAAISASDVEVIAALIRLAVGNAPAISRRREAADSVAG